MFKPLAHAEYLQYFLFLLQLERQMGGNGIGQTSGIIDACQRCQYLRRYLLVELHVLVELRNQHAAHRLGLAVRAILGRDDPHLGIEMRFCIEHADHVGALRAFHQHLHGAVRQFQHLQDIGHAADGIEIIRAGIVLGRRLLRHQRDAFAALHRRLQRLDGFGASDEQRYHHMRKDNDIAQWQ